MVRTLYALRRAHAKGVDPEDLMETIRDGAGGKASVNNTSLAEEASYSSASTPLYLMRSLIF